MGVYFLINGTQTLFPDILVIGIQGILHTVDGIFLHSLEHIVIQFLGFKAELGLADLSLYLRDEAAHLLYFLMALDDGFHHGVVVHFIGAALQHAHLLLGTADGEVQVALVKMCIRDSPSGLRPGDLR